MPAPQNKHFNTLRSRNTPQLISISFSVFAASNGPLTPKERFVDIPLHEFLSLIGFPATWRINRTGAVKTRRGSPLSIVDCLFGSEMIDRYGHLGEGLRSWTVPKTWHVLIMSEITRKRTSRRKSLWSWRNSGRDDLSSEPRLACSFFPGLL